MLYGIFRVVPGKSRVFVTAFGTEEAATHEALERDATDPERDQVTYEVEQLPEPRLEPKPAPARKGPPGQLQMF